MKRRITWITYDCFIDCDISVVGELKKYYSITWMPLLPLHSSRFKKEDFLCNADLLGINIRCIDIDFRLRYPSTYFFWLKLAMSVQKTNPDIIYMNGDISLFNLPFIWLLDKRKLIFAIHEGLIKTANKKQLWMINMARKMSVPAIKYINCFSASQAYYFSIKFPKKNIFVIPLALKNFGVSKEKRVQSEIVFFNFGTIRPKKNIDLLIDAACNIYERGYRGFKVAISGYCANWGYYLERIRYPELFICDIRVIDNSEIKDLFAKYHYLVLPYKIASQSGPMKISFHYNVPVVVSDQSGFTEEIVNGVNGFIFKTGDVRNLESVLINIIDNHENYELICDRMRKYTQERYSSTVIAAKYVKMFNNLS